MFLRDNEDIKNKINELKVELIDEYAFYILTQEGGLPEQIRICKNLKLNRYELIDSLKDIMIGIILESELHLKDKELDEQLDKDIELISVEYLASKLDIQNKKIVLFNMSEEYPCFMKALGEKAIIYAHEFLADAVASTMGVDINE